MDSGDALGSLHRAGIKGKKVAADKKRNKMTLSSPRTWG